MVHSGVLFKFLADWFQSQFSRLLFVSYTTCSCVVMVKFLAPVLTTLQASRLFSIQIAAALVLARDATAFGVEVYSPV